MFKQKPKVLTPEQVEEIRTKDFFDMILPSTVKFLSDHYIVGDFDTQFENLYAEIYAIKDELDEIGKSKSKIETTDDSIEEMTAVMNGLKNHPVEYNDLVVRQLIECIKVMSKDILHIYFKDGIKIETKM